MALHEGVSEEGHADWRHLVRERRLGLGLGLGLRLRLGQPNSRRRGFTQTGVTCCRMHKKATAACVTQTRVNPKPKPGPNPIPIPNPNPHASRRPGAACRVLAACIAARCRLHCLYCDGLY